MTLSNLNGQIVEWYSYDVFGETTTTGSSYGNPYMEELMTPLIPPILQAERVSLKLPDAM